MLYTINWMLRKNFDEENNYDTGGQISCRRLWTIVLVYCRLMLQILLYGENRNFRSFDGRDFFRVITMVIIIMVSTVITMVV